MQANPGVHQTLSPYRSAARGEVPDATAGAAESMLAAFRSHGGLASAGEVAELLRPRCGQPVSRLAGWIVTRRVLSVDSQGKLYVPLFQIDLTSGAIRAEAQHVIGTLIRAFDSRAMAHWFVEPNAWLADAAPVQVFMHDPQRVMQAARADRFVVLG